MATELIVPGLNGSGPAHWQSWWLNHRPQSILVEQDNWCQPELDDWCRALSMTIWRNPGAIVIAHSLGCATLAHVVDRYPSIPIGAALLVAPADVDRCANLPESAVRFGPLPEARFPFPAIVVASQNDPFMEFDRAFELARRWGADFMDWGASGHINAESGFGPWPAGPELADRLARAAAEVPSGDEIFSVSRALVYGCPF